MQTTAQKVIDADFEYVSGPLRVGDEHPTRKGWFWTGNYDRRGVGLWYRPPGPISRWARRIGLIFWIGAIVIGVIGGIYAGI